jgi:pyridinium-3,5-biscarboxylic acid mononucleotide sulfurtransferase
LLSDELKGKYEVLKGTLKKHKGLLVAYSGGVDSSLLMKVAHDELGDRMMAVIVSSELVSNDEVSTAIDLAKLLGIKYTKMTADVLTNVLISSNPPDRCYHCKKDIFLRLIDLAKKEGLDNVAEGSNLDDLADHRPGSMAVRELGIVSPLKEAGLNKADIRHLSKELGLSTWDKPSMACFASRVPYGTRLSKDIFDKVEKGEKYLRGLELGQVRVRHHGNLARIEIDKEHMVRLFEDGLADEIEKYFKEIGYSFVTIDLKGYRMGSMNEVLLKDK